MERARGWRRQLPNQLTLLRLVMAVAFFATLGAGVPAADTLQARGVWGLAATILFVAGAATDALDGWLARRWNAVSAFGRVMDPFVDKVLVLGAFVYLAAMPTMTTTPTTTGGDLPAISTGVAAWMATTMLARELLVTSLRGWLEGLGVAFPADPVGKAKMVLQSVAVPVVLVVATQPSFEGDAFWIAFRSVVVWATVAVTIASAVPYVQRAIRATRDAERR
jgi:CDP-diacylglycerol--glycerol-3-phosphate 3-phosphatidyltransferase